MEPFDKRAGKWWHKQLQKMLSKANPSLLPARIFESGSSFFKKRLETEEYFLQNC